MLSENGRRITIVEWQGEHRLGQGDAEKIARQAELADAVYGGRIATADGNSPDRTRTAGKRFAAAEVACGEHEHTPPTRGPPSGPPPPSP